MVLPFAPMFAFVPEPYEPGVNRLARELDERGGDTPGFLCVDIVMSRLEPDEIGRAHV